MGFLLDTHTLLWSLSQPSLLSEKARSIIEDGSKVIYVSAVNIWEISIKSSLGKLKIMSNFQLELDKCKFIQLDISVKHAFEVANLPYIHGDPFDRLLIAQARKENLTIVTRDKTIPKYNVNILEA